MRLLGYGISLSVILFLTKPRICTFKGFFKEWIYKHLCSKENLRDYYNSLSEKLENAGYEFMDLILFKLVKVTFEGHYYYFLGVSYNWIYVAERRIER